MRRITKGGWRVALLAGVLAVAAVGAGKAERTAAQDQPALMFVITGQSNAGQQGSASQLPAAARSAVSGAWYYAPQHVKKSEVVALQPYGGVFGVELSFARAVRAATGRELIFVKVYRGGTSIIAWDPEPGTPQWKYDMRQMGHSTDTSMYMYPKVLKVVRDAAAAYGRPVEMAGLLDLDVERDSKYVYGAQRYEGNLTELIGALRRDWGAPEMPAVFIDSHTNLGQGGPLVHEAVVAVAADVPGTAWVPVRDLPKKDAAHFNTQGVLTLGERLAAAWLALEAGE